MDNALLIQLCREDGPGASGLKGGQAVEQGIVIGQEKGNRNVTGEHLKLVWQMVKCAKANALDWVKLQIYKYQGL